MILGMSLQFAVLSPFMLCARASFHSHRTYNICYEVFMAPFEIVPLILSPLVVLSWAFCMWTVSGTNIQYLPEDRNSLALCMCFILKNERFFIRRQFVRFFSCFVSVFFFVRFSSTFAFFITDIICHFGRFFASLSGFSLPSFCLFRQMISFVATLSSDAHIVLCTYYLKYIWKKVTYSDSIKRCWLFDS